MSFRNASFCDSEKGLRTRRRSSETLTGAVDDPGDDRERDKIKQKKKTNFRSPDETATVQFAAERGASLVFID